MRLIDADKLMVNLRGNVLIDVTPELEDTIAQQPTAFDKDKVIEELQEAGQSCNEANDICGAEAIEYAIGIVEKGGIKQ